MTKRNEYHVARNKRPIKYCWEYLTANGPAALSTILDHLLIKKQEGGRHRHGVFYGMSHQSLTQILVKHPYFFYKGTKDERIWVTYDKSSSRALLTAWHARPIEDVVKRIVSSGRPLFKFPDFARKAVIEKYPECPENWDAAPDSPFWETVKEVRKEVLLSK
mgnify:FL=1